MAAEILDGIVQVNSLEEVSVDMVRDFLQRREVKGIILGGSSPCQGNSFFNKGRRGTGDERTWQPLQLVRVRDELTSAFPSVRFLSFLENVASMPEDVRSMYSKLMAVEPIECCEGIFGWVRRSRLYWVAASGGFSASQRGLELPLGVQTSREGRRCVVQWRGKPIPGKMRAVDGSQLTTRKPQEVVNGNGEGGALSYHAGVSAPRPEDPGHSRCQEQMAARWPKIPTACERGRELGVERCRMAHAHGRGESYIAWFFPEVAKPTQMSRSVPGRDVEAMAKSAIGNGFHLPSVMLFMFSVAARSCRRGAADAVTMLRHLVWPARRRIAGTVSDENVLKSTQGILRPGDIFSSTPRCQLDHSGPRQVGGDPMD